MLHHLAQHEHLLEVAEVHRRRDYSVAAHTAGVHRYGGDGADVEALGEQGIGARLVEKIDGDYNNVVGFPLAAFLRRCYNRFTRFE